MKRIITTAVFLVFSTISANAIDKSSFEVFSLTGGVANSQSVWGASAREKNFNDTNVLTHNKRASGVFTDGYGSQFVELGIGRFVSIGLEQQDDMQTPTNVNHEGNALHENTVAVAFNNIDTTYAKLNLPQGFYLKYGTFDVDMKITASIASGNTYGDRTASGKSVGGGVQKYFRDTGFGYRFEANLVDIDNVVTTNGVTTGSTASGGTNTVTISGMQGANAKVALTYTLGREGN
mgnify:CR=1 FL=1